MLFIKVTAMHPLRRLSLFILGALVSARIAVGLADDSGADRRAMVEAPDIVLFIVDDLGWQDTSVAFWEKPTEFQAHFRTPNLEQLAARGVRFSNAHACTVCSPTRISLLTGQNAARHRVTNWILRADRETSGQTARLEAPRAWRRAGVESAVTLPQVLRQRGYRTIHCGKAHWGAIGTAASDPRNLGFDVNIGGHAAGAPGSYQARKRYGNPGEGEPASDWGVPGLERYYGTDTHLTDALAAEAVAALEHVPTSQPAFLHFAPYAVHVPIEPHERFMAEYMGRNFPNTETPISSVEAQYASMVAGVDAALGTLITALEAQGRAEKTLIVFTSDNGGLSAHARGTTPRGTGLNTHCWPLREGKGSAYEGGTRVPLVVAWAKSNPDHPLQRQIRVTPGRSCNAPVICEDLFATVAAWAGASEQTIDLVAWENSVDRPVIDGWNWTEMLHDRDDWPQERQLLFHYPHVWGPRGAGYQPHSALQSGRYKVIYFYQPRRWELYDLQEDIGELNDLAETQPGLLAHWADRLLKSLSDHAAVFPTNRDSGEPEEPLPPTSTPALWPAPSREDRAAAAGWTAGGTWLNQHEDINRIAAAGNIDVVLLGDSITQSWGGPGRQIASAGGELWNEFFRGRRAANLGISGDRTQHVLWRIAHGNLDGLDPKVVVLLIGTNNLADDSAEDIADGIGLIVRRIEEKTPAAKIVLCSILPRGGADDSLGMKARGVNERIARLANGRSTVWLDLQPIFAEPDGALQRELFAGDNLHLAAAGYRAWGAALDELLDRLADGPWR